MDTYKMIIDIMELSFYRIMNNLEFNKFKNHKVKLYNLLVKCPIKK